MRVPHPSSKPASRLATRLLLFVVVLVGLWAYDRFQKPQRQGDSVPATGNSESPNRQRSEESPARQDSPGETSGDSLIIRDLVLRDERGKVVYRGEIDLAPTLERIAAKRSLRFGNDGATFQNRERRLPH